MVTKTGRIKLSPRTKTTLISTERLSASQRRHLWEGISAVNGRIGRKAVVADHAKRTSLQRRLPARRSSGRKTARSFASLQSDAKTGRARSLENSIGGPIRVGGISGVPSSLTGLPNRRGYGASAQRLCGWRRRREIRERAPYGRRRARNLRTRTRISAAGTVRKRRIPTIGQEIERGILRSSRR